MPRRRCRNPAAIPQDSSFEGLAAGAGLGDGAAIDAVEALLRARLVEEGRGAARVLIALALVQRATLARLDPEQRARIHACALEALERGPRGARLVDPILLAHHAWEAGPGAEARRLLPDAVASLERRGALRTAAVWRARLQSLVG